MITTGIILLALLLVTVEFNKQLIDNVFDNTKEQREWHLSQLLQWIVIYGSIALSTNQWLLVASYGFTYPVLYDVLLNKRRGLKWNHEGKHDLPKLVKYGAFVIGLVSLITLFIVKG